MLTWLKDISGLLQLNNKSERSKNMGHNCLFRISKPHYMDVKLIVSTAETISSVSTVVKFVTGSGSVNCGFQQTGSVIIL